MSGPAAEPGAPAGEAGADRPTGLLLDLQEQAAGVRSEGARFSWIVPMLGDGMQRTARVQIADDPSFDAPLWDSGVLETSQSAGLLLEDLPLEPATPCWWRVQVATSILSGWSEPSAFTTAPEDDWPAQPIWAAADADPDGPDWALLRTEVDLPQAPIRAAVIEAVGLSPEGGPGQDGPRGGRQHVYKLWVNGQVAGHGSVRSPDHRPRMHVHDVRAQLRPGRNALSVLAWAQEGRQLAARLIAILADGTRIEHRSSPQTWRARPGTDLLPTRRSIEGFWYHAPAEDWDLRAEEPGWLEPGFDDSAWPPAAPAAPLPAPPVPAIVSLEQVPGEQVRLEPVGPGRWRFDLRQEIVGGLHVEALATQGAQLEVRLGEQRDEHGQVISAMPTGTTYEETWTLREGRQHVEHWGYRAFRYGELRATSGVEDLKVTPMILRSSPRHTGAFSSSDPDLDRVHELCRASIEATSLDLYIDTPTRERGPYEGDAYVNQLSQHACERSYALARTSTQFLTRRPTWPADYHLMPVLIAWQDYLATGDDAQLREDMQRWQRAAYDDHAGADGLIRKDPGTSSAWGADLVDWPPSCRDDYEMTKVSTVLNAFRAAAHRALARIGETLDLPEDARRHTALAEAALAGIEEHLVREDGIYRDGIGTDHAAQHASAIPVALGLAPPQRHRQLGQALAAGGMRMSVYGAQFLLDALFTLRRAEAAIALMTSRGPRSWLHLLEDLGATIVPEAWDPSLKPNMTYSHAWGTAPVNVIARWVLGVRPTAPGAARLEIAPQPGPLRRMRGTVPTIRGDVRIAWDRETRRLEVAIPANTRASVRMGALEQEIGPGVSVLAA